MDNPNSILNYCNCDSCGKSLTKGEFIERTFMCNKCNYELLSSHDIFNQNIEQIGRINQDVLWFNPIDTPQFFNYYEYPEDIYYEFEIKEDEDEEEEEDYDW